MAPTLKTLEVAWDFAELMRTGEDVDSFSVGCGREGIALVSDQAAESAPSAVIVKGDVAPYRVDLPTRHPSISVAQVLPGGELLVVCRRATLYPDDSWELNAVVYGPDGVERRRFLLGDGIQRLQADAAGRIWVGYFDEGIFGSGGWNELGRPSCVGARALCRFDADGHKEWEFELSPMLIDDCYALNVTDEANYSYHIGYDSFSVFKVTPDDHHREWQTNLSGANAVAVADSRVVLYGGYPDNDYRCAVCEPDDDRLVDIAHWDLTTSDGDKPNLRTVVGRGENLHTLIGTRWYSLSTRES